MTLRIRLMQPSDIPLGMRLKAQAKWNQTESDWRRFLAMSPDGCFVAESDGKGVGTVATFTFGDVAWIAMVLVDENHRGGGIGKSLLTHAIDFLDRKGVRSIRLDATAMGRPLYEKLGFVAQYELMRFEGVAAAGKSPPLVRAASSVKEIAARDRQIAGCDRSSMLAGLMDDARVVEGRGYLLTRPGSNATQLGPCGAIDEQAGCALLDDAAHRFAGQRIFIDIPTPNAPATAWAKRAGLAAQRPFVRMCRGAQSNDRVEWLWASSGPEKG